RAQQYNAKPQPILIVRTRDSEDAAILASIKYRGPGSSPAAVNIVKAPKEEDYLESFFLRVFLGKSYWNACKDGSIERVESEKGGVYSTSLEAVNWRLAGGGLLVSRQALFSTVAMGEEAVISSPAFEPLADAYENM